jgi:hypothetical protein
MSSPNSEDELPDPDDIVEAATTVGSVLQSKEYAIIGGAALLELGMTNRLTRDVDILINTGETVAIKNLLGTHESFSLDKRTRRLIYTTASGVEVEIDVLTPQFAFIPFGPLFPIHLTQDGTKLASPAKLLHKIKSAYTRSSGDRKRADWSDVQYLVEWHTQNKVQLPPGVCPSATPEALNDLREWRFGVSDEEWDYIGGRTT